MHRRTMKLYFLVMFITTSLLYKTVNLQQECEDKMVRLVNGTNRFEGRVEVCVSDFMGNSTWKTVCDEMWGTEEATVVCRQLGRLFGKASDSDYGEGSGDIIRAQWMCEGSWENNLIQCKKTPSTMKCDHSMDAGVRCYDCNEQEIRLVNGSDQRSGRVEVCLAGRWGTVCDDGWDVNDATAVCRQLGYNDTVIGIPTREVYFDEEDQPVDAKCASDRNFNLTDCFTDRTGFNCTHCEAAGVICIDLSNCIDGDIRLVGGENEREGRVEICYNGVWGTVCDYGWDQVDAYNRTKLDPSNVICNQILSKLAQHAITLKFGLYHYEGGTGKVSCARALRPTHPSSTIRQVTSSTAILVHNASASPLPNIDTSKTSSSYIMTLITSTDDIDLTAPLNRSAIFGAVGGVLTLAIVVVIVVVFVVVMKRKRKRKNKNGGPMDNPTYDEGISVLQLAEVTAQGGGYQNPVYSNVGPRSQSTSTPPAEESLYNEISGTAASSVTVCNVEVDAANRRRETKLNGAVAEAMTSGAMYDVVAQDFDRVKEESFYSALGKSAYATLEPHIPKASQQQLPPSDSEYSHLRH